MSRQNTIAQLPDDIRSEINRRLRKTQYLGQADIRSWLSSEEYEISKSSLSRYAMALREADGVEEMNSHQLAAQEVFTSGLSRKESILIELGQLRIREIELLEELREISGQGR